MTKKIQIIAGIGYYTGSKFNECKFESGKHDSIQNAQAEIDLMIRRTVGPKAKVTSRSMNHYIVDDYSDEMIAPEYASFV